MNFDLAQRHRGMENEPGQVPHGIEGMEAMPSVGASPVSGFVDAEPLLDAAPEDGSPAASSAQLDSAGTPFDPTFHAVGPDGLPSMTPKGKFRKRRGASRQMPGEHDPEKAQSQSLGALSAASLITFCVALGGQDFTPIRQDGIDEQDNLKNAFSDYFHAKDMDDIPPGFALALAVSAYMVPRFTMPETRNRFSRSWLWIKSKFTRKQ